MKAAEREAHGGPDSGGGDSDGAVPAASVRGRT